MTPIEREFVPFRPHDLVRVPDPDDCITYVFPYYRCQVCLKRVTGAKAYLDTLHCFGPPKEQPFMGQEGLDVYMRTMARLHPPKRSWWKRLLDEMFPRIVCPWCRSSCLEQNATDKELYEYHCLACGRWFRTRTATGG